MKVVILHDRISEDARTDERDALVQAEAVSSALAELGHAPTTAQFSLDLPAVSDHLRQLEPDIVFNLVESVESLGSLIHLAPALLDSLSIPYTGAPTEAVFLTSNKLLAKQLLAANGVATPPWFTTASHQAGFAQGQSGRYIVKSVWEHASVGLDESAVLEAGRLEDLTGELRTRENRLGGQAFAERYIDGREFNLSVLAGGDGPHVLPHAEIRFVDYGDDRLRIVGYAAKWDEQSFEYSHTPRSFDFGPGDAGLLRELSRIALECWRLFDLRGYARVDFRIDRAGKPWVLEINANPCLSPDAGFAAAAQRAGLEFTEVVRRIVADVRKPLPRACG
ncbi:MAG TPA: D-alanine--D-alanine ligase [Phycisphaerae bacterium]|nr:D-alanine--D-alanine ligase [Phycisphaerae bacterium]